MKAFAIGSGLLCAATIFGSVCSPATAANLVVNGSFEEPGLKAGTWKLFGANAVNGWTPTQGSTIEIRNKAVGTAYDGNHFVELDSGNYNQTKAKLGEIEVGLFQDIMTEVGKQYKLTFAYGPRDGVNGDNKLGVSFGSINTSLDALNSGGGWKIFSQTMTATSTTTRLKFLNEGIFDTFGANIDAVSVETVAEPESVPEPFSVLGLVAVGAVGAVGTLRKRFTA